MIAKHIDRFPLLKLDQVIDWQPIEQYLNRQRTRYVRDHRGRPAYPLLSMFKAVLLGQWHSLSDPELEHSLITRIDFNLFCRFDELRPLQNFFSSNNRNLNKDFRLLGERNFAKVSGFMLQNLIFKLQKDGHSCPSFYGNYTTYYINNV